MAQKLDREARVTLQHLAKRGQSKSEIARLLGVTEGTVRYHLKRGASGAVDGRSRQVHLAESYEEAIVVWLESVGEDGPVNLAELHEYLVREHGYRGSLRSVQRYFRAQFPKPRQRARRRVETPPGAQAQVDWAEYRRLWIGGREQTAYGFHLRLSHSRYGVVVWSSRKNQLSWHHVHNEAFRRIEGVPATVRVDNEKTAMARGAGPWGELNPSYRRYALAVRFHIDPCLPRAPRHKGKVERGIRDARFCFDPRRRHWESFDELQAHTDEKLARIAKRRLCPATGLSAYASWEREKPYLGALPILPEPFDVVVTRRVDIDCLVSFEGRRYSVPFALVGRRVEVRGCARSVQVVADASVVAQHPRATPERLLIDPAHYEGEATESVAPPPPLGRMGRRLQQIAEMAPQRRPLDLYAALAEVAR